jgi:hypothetical protein
MIMVEVCVTSLSAIQTTRRRGELQVPSANYSITMSIHRLVSCIASNGIQYTAQLPLRLMPVSSPLVLKQLPAVPDDLHVQELARRPAWQVCISQISLQEPSSR